MKKHKPSGYGRFSVLAVLTMFLSATLFTMPAPVVQAADTGWRSPSADVADTGGDDDGFEEYPEHAYASGGDYARNWNGYDDRHRYYNFGFDSYVIPADAVITGIEVRLDGWVDRVSNNSPRYDVDLSWDGGSNWSSVRSTSTLGNSPGTFYVGDQSDLWEHAWSASGFSDENFRVRITSRAFSWVKGDRDFFLDWVAVRVYYATAHINGIIWADDNGNGVQDGAETGLNNIHVTIYRNDGDDVFEGGGQDPEVDSDDTNSDGIYDTGPFASGYSYWIDVDAPANRYLTTPPEPRLVYLPDDNSITENFGYAEDTSNPTIEIAKTPDVQTLVSGTTATFTIAITNTGDVTLTDVTVLDALAPNCNRATGSLPDLASGASTSYECTRANVTADFTNSATATGTSPVGTGVDDTDTALVDVINPDIEIAKTLDSQTVLYNSTVTFTIAVTNTGGAPLTNVTVSDALAPICNRAAGSLPALAPGASTSYECTRANVTADFTNSATVTGTPPIGDDVSDTDTAEVKLDRTQICPAGMIAYWRLDEVGSPTYGDFYDAHDGECAGSCPAPAAGHINGGQEFDGSNTGIDVPADGDFDWGPADSFSIEFWMKRPGTPTGNEVVVGRDDSATSLHWWVGCQGGGEAAFVLRDTSGVGGWVGGTTDLTDGFWHHVVAVRDTIANELLIYADGQVEGSKPITYSAGFDSPTALNIGWINLPHGYHFDGTADEIALYDRALSPDEIRQHHNEGLVERWYCEIGAFAPKIVTTPVTDAIVGRPYSYNVEAAGNPDPTYALIIHPSGMTIDPATGLISWTPTLKQEGSHNVEVQASNLEGTDTQSFTVEVVIATIAYWKLDETSGAIYYDSHDGHHGGCGGQCPTPVTGYISGGQEFNGSDTGIDVPAHEDFDWGPSDSFSIEFRLRTDSSSTCSGNEVVIGRDDSSTELHWWVGCRDGGRAIFYLGDTSGAWTLVRAATDLTDGKWHHVVAVRDASENEIRIYVDGVEEGSTPASYAYGFGSPTVALNIGWLNLDPFYHFDGIVDEVAIYNTALDSEALAPALPFPVYLPLVSKN